MAKYLEFFGFFFEEGLDAAYCKARLLGPGFISDLFELEFKRCPSRGVGKLLVCFTEDASKHLASELWSDVLDVYMHFDMEAFCQWDLFQQKTFFLRAIYQCLEAYAEKYGWDRELGRQTYEKILALSITFDRLWKKPVRNRATGLSAQTHVTYFNSIELSIVVSDKDKSFNKTKLIAKLPGTIGALEDAHGKLAWFDNDRVRLYRKNERDYWEYDVRNDEVSFYFARAERGDPHGQYDLGVMYLDGYLVFPNREKALYWLHRAADQNFKRAIRRLEKLEQQT